MQRLIDSREWASKDIEKMQAKLRLQVAQTDAKLLHAQLGVEPALQF